MPGLDRVATFSTCSLHSYCKDIMCTPDMHGQSQNALQPSIEKYSTLQRKPSKGGLLYPVFVFALYFYAQNICVINLQINAIFLKARAVTEQQVTEGLVNVTRLQTPHLRCDVTDSRGTEETPDKLSS